MVFIDPRYRWAFFVEKKALLSFPFFSLFLSCNCLMDDGVPRERATCFTLADYLGQAQLK